MSKIDRLTASATALSDEQLDGVIDFVNHLVGEAAIDSAPVEIRASIEQGMADAAAGRVVDGRTVYADAAARIDAKRQ